MSKDIVLVSRGYGYFMEEVPRDSLAAKTRVRMPRDPGERDDEIWINMGAGGIGDALLGLCAIKGFKRAHPDKHIVYRVHEEAVIYCGLFDGCVDGIAMHIWDKVAHDIPPDADPRDIQINAGYQQELRKGSTISRLQRYCNNLGCVQPELPVLRNPAALIKEAKTYTERIVLCPFSAQLDRNYPIQHWLTVERKLIEAGYQTVVLASSKRMPQIHGVDYPNRTDAFKSHVVTDAKPSMVAGILQSARCVISNDTGMAHLSGIMGTPTVVVCGWSVGKQIFSFYPRVTCLQGTLDCNGCWTQPDRGFDHHRCMVFCANLNTIDPDAVVKTAVAYACVPKTTLVEDD